MGFIQDIATGVSNFVGDLVNGVTGTTSAQKQNYDHTMALQKQNQQWQTEMANSAHTREVQDLENAGLNPVLSAGGSGAPTGTPGGGAVGGTGGGDPISMISAIVGALNQTKQTNINSARTDADIDQIRSDIINETRLTDAQIRNLDANTGHTNTSNKNISTRTKGMENDENMDDTWYGRNIRPVLRDIFGGSGVAGGVVAGAQASQAHTSAKKAKTPKRNKIGF